MTYGKIIHGLSACLGLLMLSSCAYDPYYRPLAAHPTYRVPSEVVVVDHGPGRHGYYSHRYRGWGDHDWDDRY